MSYKVETKKKLQKYCVKTCNTWCSLRKYVNKVKEVAIYTFACVTVNFLLLKPLRFLQKHPCQ